jgi:predicted ATPase
MCKESVRFDRLVNRMRPNFTTDASSVPRRWQSTSRTLFLRLSLANWSASKGEATLQSRVFFIRNLGFITPGEERRISFEDALRFEKIHEEAYRELGFELVPVERGTLAERVSAIKAAIR